MAKPVKKQLIEVFANPTAPYREGWVQEYVKSELKKLHIPFFQDRWGNIIGGASSAQTLKSSKKTALIAHMDHPGFHILKKKSQNVFTAQWHGGHPPKLLRSRLAIYDPQYPGKISKAVVTKQLDKQKHFQLKVTSRQFEVTQTSFGAFDFKPSVFKKDIIHTRVADDLTGVTIILATVQRLSPSERKNFLGIFTTAEETGFKGTLGLLTDGVVGKQNKAISLEASRQMVDAWIGKGPVIRLGDKKSVFDNEVSFKLNAAAEELSKQRKLKFQKRIMNGGTCEATAFNLFGIKAGGIAVPLGNYHNQKRDGSAGPEFVSIKDVEAAVELCVRFYKNERRRKDPAREFAKKLVKNFRNSKKYFETRFQK